MALITTSFINPQMLPYISTFFFVFALIFGLLSYSKIGDFSKKVNAMLALAIAAFAVVYDPLVFTLVQFMPIAAAGMIILFFIALVKKVFEEKEGKKKSGTTFPLVLSLAILSIVLITFSDNLKAYVPSGYDPNLILWAIGIIIVVGFFWGVYKYTGGATAAAAPV